MAGEGKDEAQRKKPIRVDARYYDRLWDKDRQPLPLNEQEFKFILLRKDIGKTPDISGLIESCEWRDEGTEDNLNTIPVLRGSAQLRKPHPDDPLGSINIRDGQVIRCKVKWGGQWKELWEMRIQKTTVSAGDGALTLELADDLVLLAKSKYDFTFKAGKKRHKKGFRYWEIVRRVCRFSKVPLDRKMPKGEKWIKDFEEKKISPLEAVRKAVEEEVEWSGRPMIIRWDAGKLSVKKMRRNPVLYTLKDQIRSADITKNRKAEPYTAMTGIGTMKVKKNGKTRSKKIKVLVEDKQAIKSFGYIHKTLKLGDKLDSKQQAKNRTKRAIKESLEPLILIENFTHSGIAFVRRGDAVNIRIPWEQIDKKRGTLFVVSVVHSVSGGDYTMSLTLSIKDPLDPNELREMREEALRNRKRAENRDTEGGGGGGGLAESGGPVNGGEIIGTPYSGTHSIGNWQSDNAVDIGVPVGSDVFAVIGGTIGRVEGPFTSDISGRFSGGAIYLSGGGKQFWYKHLTGSSVQPGDNVTAGQKIARSGGGNGVPHLHFAAEPPTDPQDYA